MVHPVLASHIEELKPGTLFRLRSKLPVIDNTMPKWKYFLIIGFGKTEDVPEGYSNKTIIFMNCRHKVNMPVIRFLSFFKEYEAEIELIQ